MLHQERSKATWESSNGVKTDEVFYSVSSLEANLTSVLALPKNAEKQDSERCDRMDKSEIDKTVATDAAEEADT